MGLVSYYDDEDDASWERDAEPGCTCLVIKMSIQEVTPTPPHCNAHCQPQPQIASQVIRKATARRTYTETLCLACMVRDKLPLFKDTPQEVRCLHSVPCAACTPSLFRGRANGIKTDGDGCAPPIGRSHCDESFMGPPLVKSKNRC